MFVQVVRFQLKSGASRAAFLALSERMLRWLEQREGFLAYELCESAGDWLDQIAWESEVLARRGQSDFSQTALGQEVLTLVKDGYSSFFGEVVVCSDPPSEIKEG